MVENVVVAAALESLDSDSDCLLEDSRNRDLKKRNPDWLDCDDLHLEVEIETAGN